MKHALLITLWLGIAIYGSGCATLFTADNQNITVTSDPPGANVRIGPYTCVAPCVLQIPKGKNYGIEAVYEEEKQMVPLTKKMAGTTLINILFWPGFIVDAITGNVQKYNPSEYHFVFDQKALKKD